MRIRIFLILIGAVLVVLTFTFPYWQQLLPRAEAAEVGVPGLADELQPVFAALPPDQQAAYRAILAQNADNANNMLRAALLPPVPAPSEMDSLPSMAGPVQVASGEFQRVDVLRWGQGDALIYQEVDDDKLLRFENFSVASGPNLRVVLSTSSAPATLAEIRQDNLDIDLGQLAGTTGNQNYPIPADTDLAQYGSVVIYSPSLEMVYSYAPLTMLQR